MIRSSYQLDYPDEPRPNVRLVLRRGYNARNQRAMGAALKAFGMRVLGQLRENIRTNMDGEWIPIQWGARAGGLALQGTEDQWQLEQKSLRQVVVRPSNDEYRKRWRGHAWGMTIYAKTKRFMHFFLDDGSEWFLKKVKLPKRDPRPTEDQIRSLGTV